MTGLWEISAPEATALIPHHPPAQLEVSAFGKRVGDAVCSILGLSSRFLAVIQIIHGNQGWKSTSHPLLLLQPRSCGGGQRSGGGGVSIRASSVPSSQGSVRAPSSPGSRGSAAPRSRSASRPGLVRRCLRAPGGCRVGGAGGGLGECPMGMKTRRQVEGTVWRPDWPCVSRSGHDWVAGQDGLRPGEESSRHWWEAPWGRGGRRSPKGMFQKESEASVSSHRVKSLLTNT